MMVMRSAALTAGRRDLSALGLCSSARFEAAPASEPAIDLYSCLRHPWANMDQVRRSQQDRRHLKKHRHGGTAHKMYIDAFLV